MKNALKKAASSVLLAFTLVAGGTGCESSKDIAEKPGVADALTKISLEQCNTGSTSLSASAYAKRLHRRFMDTRTADLRTLRDENITVCLDRRLEALNLEVNDGKLEGIFYGGYPSGVVSLKDGDSYNQTRVLEEFAEKVRSGNISDTFMYASVRCRRGCITEWLQAEKVGQDMIRSNPQLKTPPLKNLTLPNS